MLDKSNMKQHGIAANSYAADYEDKVYSFTWRGGVPPESPFGAAGNDTQAAADQAVWIIRNRSGRTNFGRITGWIPHILYTHLVLNDYLAQRLPERMVVSPKDRHRLLWQTDPIAFDNGEFLPNPNGGPAGGWAEKRWPYSSSYRTVPCSFSPDYVKSGVATVTQASAYNVYYVPGGSGILGRRLYSEVQFPAQKVLMFSGDSYYFNKRPQFYAYEDSRAITLLFDGSVEARLTITSNEGFFPGTPTSDEPDAFAYNPPATPAKAWESRPRNGGASETVYGWYQWTRGGLRGVDFNGSGPGMSNTEVNTGNPGKDDDHDPLR